MEVIVGTAGHIDHGKTALVKALTGVDADRLPEEQARGITIDIGFAELSLDDVHIGFVDVPGHERFVKNMLAGASGIDLLLLVVAASEGVMPQTREHFEICRLLGIRSGVVALTKTDAADADTIELAKLDVAELVAGSFLENAPVVPVSARAGTGLHELKQALVTAAHTLAEREDRYVARLPIDRSFSIKGFGAVVTGTLASGAINDGDELDLLPTGRRVRVRGMQTHGHSVSCVDAGRRVAVNLGGIDHSEIERGMTLATPGALRPTQIIDADVEVLPGASRPLRSRQRIRFHIGTVEALGRAHVLNESDQIAPGENGLVQFRLELPVVAVPGERFIIRSYSPQVTIAGGILVHNAGVKFRRKDRAATAAFLESLATAGNDTERVRLLIENSAANGLTAADLQARSGLRRELLNCAIEDAVAAGAVVGAGDRLVATRIIDALTAETERSLQHFHKREPLARGMAREELRDRVFARTPDVAFQYVLAAMAQKGRIVADKETVRLASHSAELSPEEELVSERILNAYRAAALEVHKAEAVLATAMDGTALSQTAAQKLFRRHVEIGGIVKVTDEFYFSRESLDRLIAMVRKHAATTPDRLIDVPRFKDLAGVSRKYAIPLLEYLDREHVTARAGDKRIIL